MRITREALLKLAGDFVTQRLRSDPALLGIFLQGALLEGDPFLGGITDIDLFLVHSDAAPQPREIVRISDEIHLDLAHHARSQYRQPRELRSQTWLGYCIEGGRILYDPQHFLDFTQASVRGHFHRADHVLIRARKRLDQARRKWLELQGNLSRPSEVQAATQYLQMVEDAANAVAGLSGPPLTERRFMQQFPARAAAVQRPGFEAALSGLLGAAEVEVDQIRSWIPSWQEDYHAIPVQSAPARLHPDRYQYHLRGIEALLGGEKPKDALWPLLHTWVIAAGCQPAISLPGTAWHQALRALGLLGEGLQSRLEAMDALLDTIDELLESWGREHGA